MNNYIVRSYGDVIVIRKFATKRASKAHSTLRKDFVILQLYWWLFSRQTTVAEILSNAW